jgi:hypothetical protein
MVVVREREMPMRMNGKVPERERETEWSVWVGKSSKNEHTLAKIYCLGD